MGIGIVTNVLAARALGPEGRGSLTALLTYAQVIWLIGLFLTGGNDVLPQRSMRRSRLHVSWTLLTLTPLFGIIVVAAVLLSVAVPLPLALPDILLLGLFVYLFALETCLRDTLQNRRLFMWLNAMRVVAAGTTLLMVSLGYAVGVNVVRFFFVAMLVQQAVLVVAYLRRVPPSRGARWSRRYLLARMKLGARVFVFSLPYVLLQRMDVIALSILSSLSVVGIYAPAMTIAGLFLGVSGLLHRVIKSTTVTGMTARRDIFWIAAAVWAVGMLMYAGLFPIAATLFDLLFGAPFAGSAEIVLWLWPASVTWGAGSILSAFVLSRERYPPIDLAAMYLVLAVGLGALVFLVPSQGALGTAIVRLCVSAAVLLYYAFRALRQGDMA